MAELLKRLWVGYDTIFNVWSDPRTSVWPLMGSPFPTIGILAFYLYFVNTLGPQIMKDRKPLELKNIMIVFNIIQVILNLRAFYYSMVLGWGGKYSFICEPVDFSNSDHAMDTAKIVYFYLIIKLLDLLDTLFFVFRKKQSHVSFLHVYHHTGMVVLIWCATKYLPGGHGTSLGLVNSVVHVIMYGYYLLTAIDAKYKKSIWWKRHITQLQILQFLFLVLHFASLLVVPNCGYPVWVAGVIIPQNLFMLLLFCDFYVKTYMKKSSKRDENGVQDHEKNGIETKQKNGYNTHAIQSNGVYTKTE